MQFDTTIEYNGCIFDISYEFEAGCKGDGGTTAPTSDSYTVTRIGIDGILIPDEHATALKHDIFEVLSEKLTNEKNEN